MSESVTSSTTSTSIGATSQDWDMNSMLKYGIPLGAVGIVAAGAFYFSKKMGDLETQVQAIKRNEVRHLSETDVRMIVQQMSNDGQIQVGGAGGMSEKQQQLIRQVQEHQRIIVEQQKAHALLQQQFHQYLSAQVAHQHQNMTQTENRQVDPHMTPNYVPIQVDIDETDESSSDAAEWKPK